VVDNAWRAIRRNDGSDDAEGTFRRDRRQSSNEAEGSQRPVVGAPDNATLLYSAGYSIGRSHPLPPPSACPSPGRRILFWSPRHQAHLPTQEEISAQDTRVSHPHVDAGRTSGAQGASPQGPQAPHARASPVISRHRLRGRGRFAAVRAAGARASAGSVRVTVAPNHGDHARIGFALPGQRSAVARNLLRRRLREVIRPLLAELAGWDVVVAVAAEAQPGAFGPLRADVLAAVAGARERAGRLPGRSTGDNALMTAVPARS
jgi:ribonuclease P protein component